MPENPIELTTGAHPSFSVIWLHGLGADGSDFVPVMAELGLPKVPAGRFVFPHAPYVPVTCNGGYEMRAWYDIVSLEPDSRTVDVKGLLASRETLCQLIEREIQRGIPASRIFIAGFSQGGAVAYVTALTHPIRLGGVIALSTYIPAPDLLTSEATQANCDIPIFAAHGTHDDIVSIELGLKARSFLESSGYHPDWHTYPMTHSVCLDEIRHVGAWLIRLLDSSAQFHNRHDPNCASDDRSGQKDETSKKL